MSLRFYPRRELGKQGGNNPGADTNPPEDQEDAVERVPPVVPQLPFPSTKALDVAVPRYDTKYLSPLCIVVT